MRGSGCRVVNAGRRHALLLGTVMVAQVCPVMPASADTVRVLAAGATQGVLLRLEADFAAGNRHRLDAAFDTVGALRDQVLAGARADVVILSQAGIDALAKAGKLAAGAPVDLGTISVALAVRTGSVLPDVSSSPEALKQTLLRAASIAHADPARGATAGAHFAAVLQKLGIADELRSRVTILAFGGDVIAGVAQGRFEIGVSQSSEIIAHPGVALAGNLPERFAHRTRYLAAKTKTAGPAADDFLGLLAGPQGRAVLQAMGLEAP